VGAQPVSNGRLNSWKEIAEYFATTVRTVQRWEAERGLPVRRLPGAARGRVFALVSELDSWAASGDGPDAGPEAVPEPPASARRRRVWPAVALLGAAALAIAVSMFQPWKGRLASWRVEANALVATDAEGREIWRKAFPEQLNPEVYKPEEGMPIARVGDIDGDGRPELLFNYYPGTTDSQALPALVCYSGRGAEMWRYVPGRPVSSRDEKFNPTFGVATFTAGRAGNLPGTSVVVVSQHTHYPSPVAVLDSRGRLADEYWHSGHLRHVHLADFDGDGRNEIFLVGISNGYHAATIVVLDPGRLGGASAEQDAHFQLLDFPSATEAARVILPRTCLNRIFEKYPVPVVVHWRETGFQIDTHEWQREGVLFEFGYDLRVRQAGWRDASIAMHGRLRAEGKLDHDWSPRENEELYHPRFLRGGPGVARVASGR
jgi:hypothetical protein